MVESSVPLYISNGHLTSHHDLASSLFYNDQFDNMDQHSSMPLDSPRVSSTPPSTPGLDSIQDKEAKEQQQQQDDDDDDDDDEMDDLDDYHNNNYGYDEYLNAYDSEPDEDHFFKDFATTSLDNGNNTTRQRKSKRYSRRQRSQKAMSKFDLQSFARQLHANRLSVLQTRQSRMILTEEDERELDKLLARKYSHDSTASLSAPPPVPALPSVPASLPPPSSSTPSDTPTLTTPASEKQQLGSNPSSSSKATVVEPVINLAGPISPDYTKKPSLLLQKLNDQRPSFGSKNSSSLVEMAPLSPSLSDPSSFTSPRRAPNPPSPSSPSSSSSSATEKNHINQPATTITLSPAPATFAIKKKSSWISNHKLNKTQQKATVGSPLSATAPQPRKSMSVDTLRDQTRQKESWKMTTTTNKSTIKSTKTTNIPSPVLEDAKKPKLRLFGSLRQASRSSGEGGFRGLMRNLSTVGQRQQQPSLSTPQEQEHQQDSTITDNTSMSRAAMAAIQHDVSTKKKTSNKKSLTSNSTQEMDPAMMEGVDDSTVQVTHTATSTKGGVRLLTNLLAKARSRRTATTKKTTNMQTDGGTNLKERNKVVRRTIIYVQPDALDFMKDGHLPPIPAPRQEQDRFSKDTLLEEDTVEYATATKVTRQVSRRKRLVEEPTEPQQQPLDQEGHKKWRLESVSEVNIAGQQQNDEQDNNGSLEGLELREMSDGSVVWGIVKKQGNRKSFFASKALEDRMMEWQQVNAEHEQIEKSVLALMGLEPDSLDHFSARLSSTSSTSQSSLRDGKKTTSSSSSSPPPIPKRSPRRNCPELEDSKRLQRGLSVEEQLDEMMLSIEQSHF